MLTLPSTNRETESIGSGELEDAVSHQRLGCGGDRTGRVARAIGESLGARRSLSAESPHNGTANLTSAPFER